MSASLDELRGHARLTFRYWPIYLVLRLRELEQHLDPSVRPPLLAASPVDVSALVAMGLWDGPPPPGFQPPPPLTLPAGETLTFGVRASGAAATLHAHTRTHRLDLLCAPLEHEHTLQAVAYRFGALPDWQSALDTARLWAVLHGARPLDWRPISDPEPDGLAVMLPRRRGKGVFRNP